MQRRTLLSDGFHASWLYLCLAIASNGCGAAGRQDDALLGEATFAVVSAPQDALCLQVTVTGARTVQKLVALAPGGDTTFTLEGLPLGKDTFSELAFSVACAAVTPNSVATWISDPVVATLKAGVVANVTIVLHRDGQAHVTTNFQEDPDAGSAGSGGSGGAGGTMNTGGTGGGSAPAPTGAPCTAASDCLGTNAKCTTQDASNRVWPGGYCTSQCNPLFNDESSGGQNPNCPGDGTCAGSGSLGTCFALCTSAAGENPCVRQGYSCFFVGTSNGCMPTSLSECNPSVRGSCPSNATGDGGTSPGVCQQAGLDPVGACIEGCDVFAQTCSDLNGTPRGCYAEMTFGDGTCTPTLGGGGDGIPCTFSNNCDPGFSCHIEGNQRLCRAFCGGPNTIACAGGKSCVDLSPTVPKSTVGICSP